MLIRQRRDTLEAERFDPARPWPIGVARAAGSVKLYCVWLNNQWYGIEPQSVIVRKADGSAFVVGPDEFRREWEIVDAE